MKVFIVLALALASTILGSCSAASSKTVLDVWAMGREGEVVGELVPEFERENPGVTVRIQQLPFSAAHEKLLTAFVGDAMPDMAQLGNSWVPEFAALGAIEPLDAHQTRVVVEAFYPAGFTRPERSQAVDVLADTLEARVGA